MEREPKAQGSELELLRQRVKLLEGHLAAVMELEMKISASVPGLAFVYDTNTELLTHICGNCIGTLGYTAEELLEMGSLHKERIFHADDMERLMQEREKFRAEARDDEILSTKARIRKKDGEIRWILLSRSVSKRNPDHSVAEVVGSFADITGQVEAEKELRLAEFSVAKSRDCIFWVRADGRFHSVNPAACEALGYTHEEFLKLRLEDVSKKDKANSWAVLPPLRTEKTHHFETELVCKDGATIPVEVSGTWLEFEGDEYLFAFLRDISERKRIENGLREALLENQKLKEQVVAENVFLREEIRLTQLHGNMVGTSKAMKSVILLANQVAGTDSTVLLQGETGTGKELMARAIHEMSKRTEGPLVVVNCAAIPTSLVESELFGHERGAFTGAHRRQIGRFEAANGGTIFLDEIGELPEDAQAKLLRVLEEGQVDRLGATKSISVNVRVIAATNRNLQWEVSEGTFRGDLFYRLNVFPLELPPLRDREGDASILAWRFVEEFSEKMGKPIESISRKSIDEIESYPWPGNVRELRNVIERAMIRNSGKTLVIESPGAQQKLRKLAEVEKEHIIATLERLKWKVRGKDGAAIALGLPPTTLESRMKKLDIRRPMRRA